MRAYVSPRTRLIVALEPLALIASLSHSPPHSTNNEASQHLLLGWLHMALAAAETVAHHCRSVRLNAYAGLVCDHLPLFIYGSSGCVHDLAKHLRAVFGSNWELMRLLERDTRPFECECTTVADVPLFVCLSINPTTVSLTKVVRTSLMLRSFAQACGLLLDFQVR